MLLKKLPFTVQGGVEFTLAKELFARVQPDGVAAFVPSLGTKSDFLTTDSLRGGF